MIKKLSASLRIFLIKEGLLSPSSLKESQQIFKFPEAIRVKKTRNPIWMTNSIQVLPRFRENG